MLSFAAILYRIFVVLWPYSWFNLINYDGHFNDIAFNCLGIIWGIRALPLFSSEFVERYLEYGFRAIEILLHLLDWLCKLFDYLYVGNCGQFLFHFKIILKYQKQRIS